MTSNNKVLADVTAPVKDSSIYAIKLLAEDIKGVHRISIKIKHKLNLSAEEEKIAAEIGSVVLQEIVAEQFNYIEEAYKKKLLDGCATADTPCGIIARLTT